MLFASCGIRLDVLACENQILSSKGLCAGDYIDIMNGKPNPADSMNLSLVISVVSTMSQ